MKSVEAVFDWKAYLNETFGYEVDDSWLVDEPTEDVKEEETEDVMEADADADDDTAEKAAEGAEA